jgi:saccharopine dehydrogenase-like NADP-dependent oxidoreductase
MKYDFLVLGADGMQGGIVVQDLLESGYSVFAADLYKDRIIGRFLKHYKKDLAFSFVDCRDPDLTENLILKAGAEVVVNCAEGDTDLPVYKACLQARAHVIDLGSHIGMTKKQLEMDGAFRRIKRTAITGCGSVPGVGNVMLRHAARKFDKIDTVEVGFAWDSNVKKFVVPFSMESILEEYTYPAPYVVGGRWRKKVPSDSAVTRYHRGVGHQRSFLADHAETYTFHHYFRKKGLKNIKFYAGFPDHSERIINALVELGFDDKRPVKVGKSDVVPAEFLSQLLKRLKQPRGYKEWENLWVEVTGRLGRKKRSVLMECIVPTLPGWEYAGCNVDTGMPASIIAQMIYEGDIRWYGSFAPEAVVPEKPFFKQLRKRKMAVYENGERIN